MNKIQLIGLVILIAISSCKKNDIENNTQTESAETTIANSNQASGWSAIQNWNSAGNSSQSSITDEKITAGIAANGLVLLYVKTNNATTLLPAKVEKTDFYYQVEDGAIQINAITENSASPDTSFQFTYLIFSKEELQKLEEKGFSRSKLVKMEHAQVKQLSN